MPLHHKSACASANPDQYLLHGYGLGSACVHSFVLCFCSETPLADCRLKRVDSPSEAFSASQVGTGSTLASFLALKASPASPRPGSEAQAARLSQRDSSTHPCTAPAKDSTQPSTSGAKDGAQPSATRTKDMAALLSSSSKPVQKGSSAAPSPRLGRSVASVPHTPRADPVTYESSRLGSARGEHRRP